MVICCKFKKNLFNLWLYTHLFMIYYMYRAAGQGQTTPGDKFWCQQKPFVTSVICYKFKKNLFGLILYICVMILYMYIVPRQGLTTPWGRRFWCWQKDLITLHICLNFRRNLFKVWFDTFFSWFNTCIKARGRGAYSPRGQSFDVNRNFLSLRSFVASFKSW